MTNISVNQFRDNLKYYADLTVKNHEVITVSRRNHPDIVIMGAEDWQNIEETFYVLQNPHLMVQIESSLDSHMNHKGRPMAPEESDEINRV